MMAGLMMLTINAKILYFVTNVDLKGFPDERAHMPIACALSPTRHIHRNNAASAHSGCV
jgi:hypothetical protein